MSAGAVAEANAVAEPHAVADSAAGQRPRALVWLGAASAAPAFAGYADYILNHFYRYGGVLLDAGLLASIAWRSRPDLPVAPVYPGMSFYAFHVSPIMTLLSALSWLVPMSMAQWFALFTGLSHALLAVAVFWLLTTEHRMDRGWRALAAAGAAALFSFNGLAIAQVRYPHFEILLAASLILFLVAWRRRRWPLAAAFFVLCLACREDAGFHIFAVLAVVVVLARFDGTPLRAQKPAIVFAALGFTYSAGALVATHLLFPHYSNFARVYLGDPPYAYLSVSVVWERLLGVLVERSYIVLPFVCAAIWAVLARNVFIVAGYLAFIPWLVVNLLAHDPLPSTLSSYYAFPFLIAAAWPLIGCRMKPLPAGAPAWAPLAGFMAMVLVSFSDLSIQHDPGRVPLLAGFAQPPSLAEQARVERAMDAIEADHSRLKRVLAGDGVAALRPRVFSHGEVFPDTPGRRRDTVLYFPTDRTAGEATAIAKESGLGRRYAIDGTPIRIATDVPPGDLPHLGPLLRASS